MLFIYLFVCLFVCLFLKYLLSCFPNDQIIHAHSYELMWIFNCVRLTPRLTIGDVHNDLLKLRVIDKVKASVASVHERREFRQQVLCYFREKN